MSSPGHRANILQRQFREIGIGDRARRSRRLRRRRRRHLHGGLRGPPLDKAPSGRAGSTSDHGGGEGGSSIRRRRGRHHSPARSPLRPRPHAAASPPVAAPPYDVIDAAERAALVARSPYNVVEIDLPEDPAGGDPYAHAAAAVRALAREGVVVARRASPPCGRSSRTTPGPDGRRRTRHGLFARVRVEDYGPGRIRPHERTHPGPKEDRLRLTRATRANLSPIFSLYDGPTPWSPIAPQLDGAPVGRGDRRGRHGATGSGASPTRTRSRRRRTRSRPPSC